MHFKDLIPLYRIAMSISGMLLAKNKIVESSQCTWRSCARAPGYGVVFSDCLVPCQLLYSLVARVNINIAAIYL